MTLQCRLTLQTKPSSKAESTWVLQEEISAAGKQLPGERPQRIGDALAHSPLDLRRIACEVGLPVSPTTACTVSGPCQLPLLLCCLPAVARNASQTEGSCMERVQLQQLLSVLCSCRNWLNAAGKVHTHTQHGTPLSQALRLLQVVLSCCLSTAGPRRREHILAVAVQVGPVLVGQRICAAVQQLSGSNTAAGLLHQSCLATWRGLDVRRKLPCCQARQAAACIRRGRRQPAERRPAREGLRYTACQPRASFARQSKCKSWPACCGGLLPRGCAPRREGWAAWNLPFSGACWESESSVPESLGSWSLSCSWRSTG